MSVRTIALHGFTGTPQAFDELELRDVWIPFLSGHGPDPDLSAASYEQEVERLSSGIRRRCEEPIQLDPFRWQHGSPR